MTRKKLNLAYIANDSTRKATFNKRKKGFVKKIHELSVLCGIEACAVIYNPFNSNPDVWPSNVGVKKVVEKFGMMTEMEQEKKMVNHEGFLRQNISKIIENNNKKMKDNTERTMKEAMFHLLNGENFKLTGRDREELCKYIDQYLKELYHHKKEIFNQSHFEYGESSSATNAMAPTSMVEMNSYSIPNLDVLNSSPLTNDLWSVIPIISSNQPEQINTFSGNFLQSVADPQGYYPIGVYDDHPDLNHHNHNQYQYQQPFGFPTMGRDGIYNPGQNMNWQEEWLVDQMINHHEATSFPLMDNNNCYNYQQP